MKPIYNKHFKTTKTDQSAEQLLEKHIISLFNTETMLRMDLLLASTGRKYHVHMFLMILCDVELYINKCLLLQMFLCT